MKCKHCHREISFDSYQNKWEVRTGYMSSDGSLHWFHCDVQPGRGHKPEEKENLFDKLYLTLKK